MQAFWIRRVELEIIGQVTPLANLILIHASNLSFLRGFLPPSGCVVYTTNGFLSRLNVWGTAVTATSRMLIGTLALTQLCDPIASFAAKNKPAASQTVTVKLPAPPKLKQVQGDQRILHALDRLTFGPRPGELEEVKAIGLDAWITQQLHPATIDDFAMEQRLQRGGLDAEIPSRQHHPAGGEREDLRAPIQRDRARDL
jgi:hypothetical protein